MLNQGTGPQHIRAIGGDDPKTTRPVTNAETKDQREFLWRRQEQQLAAAHAAGHAENSAALTRAAMLACVPEDLLTALRTGSPAAVTIRAMSVTVIPTVTGAGDVDPADALAVWEALRQVVARATLAAGCDTDLTDPQMPARIRSVAWRTTGGHHIRVTSPTRWFRRPRKRGATSLLPVAGLFSAKLACVTAAVVVSAGIAETPGGPPTSLTPAERVVMREEYVPPTSGLDGKAPARTVRLKRPKVGVGQAHHATRPTPPATKPAATRTPRQPVTPQTPRPVPDTPPLVIVPSVVPTILDALTGSG